MATAPTITYPLDLDGNSPANLVQRELQVLIPQNDTPYRFFIPVHAPFYITNLLIEGKSETGQDYVLKEGIDYHLTMQFIGATRSTGQYVYAGITIINIKVQGPFYMTYQCLGDKYSADRNYVVKTIADLIYNPRKIAWDQVTSIQETFPPTPHPQDVDTMTEFRDMIDAVDRLNNTVALQPGPNNIIWKHILDLNDPHLTLRLIPAVTDFATKQDVAKAILDHTLEPNPHNQYLLKDDYVPGGGGDMDCDECIAKHVAEQNPHPQYITTVEAQAMFLTETQADELYIKFADSATTTRQGIVRFATVGEHTTGAIANAAATPAGVKAVMDAHEAKADPHPQYFNQARGDARYLTKAQAAADFVSKQDLQTDFPTRAEIERDYLKKVDADNKFQTPAQADAKYQTPAQADAKYPTKAELSQDYLTKDQADKLYGPNGTAAYRPPASTTTIVGITRYATRQEHLDGAVNTAAVTPGYMREAIIAIVEEELANAGGTGGGSCCDPAYRLFFTAR